jgi:hypothetical protein
VGLRLAPVLGACHNYVDSSGSERRVTVVIAPIGVERRNEKTVISWACNRGATCRNPECRYSKAFKEAGQVPVASMNITEE